MKRLLASLTLAALPLSALIFPLAQIGGGIFGKPRLIATDVENFGAIAGAPACQDASGATSVVGAVVGDYCKVGYSVNLAGGNQDQSFFFCYVATPGNAVIRHCSFDAAEDPDSMTFTIEVTPQ